MVSESLNRIEQLRSNMKAASTTNNASSADSTETIPASVSNTTATAASPSDAGVADAVVTLQQQQKQEPESASIQSSPLEIPDTAANNEDPIAHNREADHRGDHSPPRSFSQRRPGSSFSSFSSSSSRTNSNGSNSSSGNSRVQESSASAGGGVLSSLWSAVVKAPHQSTTLPAPYAVPFGGELLCHNRYHSGSSRNEGADGGGALAANAKDPFDHENHQGHLIGWPLFPPPPLGRTSLRLAQDIGRAHKIESERCRDIADDSASSSSSSSSTSECKDESKAGHTIAYSGANNGHAGGSVDGERRDDVHSQDQQQQQHDGRRTSWGLKSRQKEPQSQWARCSSCGAFVARGVNEISDHIATCDEGGAVSAYQGTHGFASLNRSTCTCKPMNICTSYPVWYFTP